MTSREKQAQDAEQKLRDERDRQTRHDRPKPRGEPRYRDGADHHDTGAKGWSEVEGADEPPKGQG